MKKQSYLVKIMLSTLLLLTLLVINSGSVTAEEGVQVPTKGEITLVDGSNVSSSEQQVSSSSEGIVKPQGRLPSSGELVKYSLFFSGLLIVLLVCLFYFITNRTKSTKKNKGGQ
ncbi:hypothetical protein IGJ02_000141 [Enterococcus sp. DIV0724b]|uniref:LPXTG cell wall anchor domain-containing protein n=1 Tax=Enterococcus sp. DIV0724b TaxID=2774694 RepID=UPI003D2FA502